jgi:hemerythrin-like domain-containing protein
VSIDERGRIIAWNNELLVAHDRLRDALRVARDAAASGDAASATSARADLLLFCHGFCVALDGHHTGEDGLLFPELLARHPELRKTIAALEQDHAMIGTLIRQLQAAISSSADAGELARHLEGIAAIMESHFRYEEKRILDVLRSLELDADPHAVFGPL